MTIKINLPKICHIPSVVLTQHSHPSFLNVTAASAPMRQVKSVRIPLHLSQVERPGSSCISHQLGFGIYRLQQAAFSEPKTHQTHRLKDSPRCLHKATFHLGTALSHYAARAASLAGTHPVFQIWCHTALKYVSVLQLRAATHRWSSLAGEPSQVQHVPTREEAFCLPPPPTSSPIDFSPTTARVESAGPNWSERQR